jgi:hypothetical protein
MGRLKGFGPYRLLVEEFSPEPADHFVVGHLRKLALKQLSELEHAPSVQMQDVPRQSLHEHLGLSTVGLDEEEADEIDERLAREYTHSETLLLHTRNYLTIYRHVTQNILD